MTSIARHAVDPELVDEGVERFEKTLARSLTTVVERPGALPTVLEAARGHAGYLAAANAPRAEVGRALRIGAEAANAIFALGTGSGEIEFTLDGRPMRHTATGPTGATYPGTWRIGWWMAHLVGDDAAIDTLAATPIELLRASGTATDECQYRFVEALQGYQSQAPTWGDSVQAAVEATDPEAVALIDEEFVLNILVPEMQLLFYLGLHENTSFRTSFEFALQRHKKYWSKADRKRNPDGFLALGPMALAALASAAGMPVETESDYAPAW
jgi:hypothetical protein